MLKGLKIFILIFLSKSCGLQSKFLLLMGPSGAGKSTLIRYLKELDHRFEYVTPLTTRNLRENEQDKIHMSLEEINRLKDDGKLLAINTLYGNAYATPKYIIDHALAHNRFPILDWPIEKLEIMEKNYNNQLYKVYILPEDKEELKRRLSQDNRDEDGKRFISGVQEIETFSQGKYDHAIDLKLINHKDNAQEIAQYIYIHFIKSLESE